MITVKSLKIKNISEKTRNGLSKSQGGIDGLFGLFLGISNVYRIDFPPTFISEKKDLPFNKLLLTFFAKTNDLHVEENEKFYNLENKNMEIDDKVKNTYYECEKFLKACAENYKLRKKNY